MPPISASPAGQNCIKNGGEVVVLSRSGKHKLLCKIEAHKQSTPRNGIKPPPDGDGSPGPYGQGGGHKGKTLSIKPSPIAPSKASAYCHAGSPPPCPPNDALGSDATQGDLNQPIVGKNQIIKPPYSPTNPPPPMGSKTKYDTTKNSVGNIR